MKKRIAVLTLWVILLTLFIPSVSFAYIDPATTTYIIQVFTAIVITLGVALSVFIYKFRMIFTEAKTRIHRFFIQISKGKGLDSGTTPRMTGGEIPPRPGYGRADIIWGSGDTPQGQSSFCAKTQNPLVVMDPGTSPRMTSVSRMTGFKTRVLLSSLVSCAISFTFIVFGVLELTITNSTSLPFSIAEIFNDTLLIGLITALVLTAFLVIFRGHTFEIIVSCILALLLCGYLQGNFFNINFGELIGDNIPWNQYYKQTIVNIVIWLAIFAAIFAIRHFSKKTWRMFAVVVPALLILIQGVALVSIFPHNIGDTGKSGAVVTNFEKNVSYDGLTEISKEKNVVVFLMDRLDQRYVEEVLADDKDFFKPLDGFTMYTQNVGAYYQTYPAIAFMLTGKYFLGDEPPNQYLSEAYKQSEFFDEMHKAGMRVNLFTGVNNAYLDIRQIEGSADNISNTEVKFYRAETLKKLVRLSAFRYAPLALKPSFYISTEDFDDVKRSEDQNDAQPYHSDDPVFYKKLLHKPLSVSDKYKGTFQFYHMMGSHTPYTMNENAEFDERHHPTRLQQTKGCFKIVYEYIAQLKKLGLYEDTTIIITSDHGYTNPKDGNTSDKKRRLKSPELSGLFYKPSGSSGAPLQVSDAEVAQLDFRATVMEELGLPYEKYGTPYDQVGDNRGTPRIHYHRSLDANGERSSVLEEWKITGDARNFDNWKKVRELQVEYWKEPGTKASSWDKKR